MKKFLYEVSVPGVTGTSIVYNGYDQAKAEHSRDVWKADGYKVKFLAFDVSDIKPLKTKKPKV